MRVLHVLNGMHAGGIQSFLATVHNHINRDRIQFDYLVRYADIGLFEPMVKELGGDVFHVPHTIKHPRAGAERMRDFFSKRSYHIAHFHYGFLQNMMPIRIARDFGIPMRIMHAHSADYKWRGVRERLFQANHAINKRVGLDYATHWLACSEAAARWFSFDHLPASKKWQFLPNGIETNRFRFNQEYRHVLRHQLGLNDDNLCVGNVGRLSSAKNQSFLLEVFRFLLEIDTRTHLVIVGSGELERHLKDMAKSLGIDKNTHFLGEAIDVARFYNCMDIFAFPSLAEGLGIALLEAQANGLPCIVSERIPKEAILCSSTAVLELNQGPRKWAEFIASQILPARIPENINRVQEAGYDIAKTAERLTQLYLGKEGRSLTE